MLLTYAVVDSSTNRCVNIIVYDEESYVWSPPDGCYLIQDTSINIDDIVTTQTITSDAKIN